MMDTPTTDSAEEESTVYDADDSGDSRRPRARADAKTTTEERAQAGRIIWLYTHSPAFLQRKESAIVRLPPHGIPLFKDASNQWLVEAALAHWEKYGKPLKGKRFRAVLEDTAATELEAVRTSVKDVRKTYKWGMDHAVETAVLDLEIDTAIEELERCRIDQFLSLAIDMSGGPVEELREYIAEWQDVISVDADDDDGLLIDGQEEWDNMELPDPDWLCRGLNIPRGGLGYFVGATGSGKSFLLWEIALAVANDRPVVERFKVPLSRALIIDAENSPILTHPRVQAMMCGRDEDEGADSFGNMTYRHWPGLDLLKPRHVRKLRRLIEEGNYDLVGFDSMRRIQSGDENDSKAMAAVGRVLRDIASLGPAVIVIHHLRKPKEGLSNFIHGARGSGDILANADFAIEFRNKGNNQYRVQDAKPPRWGAPMQPWAFSVTGYWADQEAIKVRWQGEVEEDESDRVDECLREIVDLLDERGELTRKDIDDAITLRGYSRRTISPALKAGRADDGPLAARKEGKHTYYFVVTAADDKDELPATKDDAP
jgi:RecA-family ATPase